MNEPCQVPSSPKVFWSEKQLFTVYNITEYTDPRLFLSYIVSFLVFFAHWNDNVIYFIDPYGNIYKIQGLKRKLLERAN